MRVFLIKQYFLIVFLLLSGVAAGAQVLGRFYYNKYWELTRSDSAVFFRVSGFDTTRMTFADSVHDFTSDGKLLMKGMFKDGMKDGEFTFYYLSGAKEMVGHYLKDNREDKWTYYYENGKPKQEVDFSNEPSPVVIFYNDSNGNEWLTNGTGTWAEEYVAPVGHRYEHVSNKGWFHLGAKNGQWVSKENGKVLYKEDYDFGKFQGGYLINDSTGQSTKYTDPINNKLPPPARLKIMEDFTRASTLSLKEYPFIKSKPPAMKPLLFNATKNGLGSDVFPGFKGGSEALSRFVAKRVNLRSRNFGKIFVSFVVEKDGSISNVWILRGINEELDTEAVRAVVAFPQWTPGMQNGKPVRVKFILPINVGRPH